jgi:hypothetical protein
MTMDKSPVLACLGSLGSTNVLRCPMDQNDSFRTNSAYTSEPPYWFSFEATSYNLNGTINYGLTTIITDNGAYYFKATSVRNASQKIMIAEGVEALLPNDAPPGCSKINTTGRFQPMDNSGNLNNFLTLRHGGKADVAFDDAHAALVPWQYGTNAANSQPGL